MITSNIPDRRQQSGRKRALRISPGRIGRWSARHPWLALTIWGAFVAGCVTAGAAAGTKTLSNGLVGESARGYAVMSQYGLPPPRETPTCTAARGSAVILGSHPPCATWRRASGRWACALARRFPRTATRSWCLPVPAVR